MNQPDRDSANVFAIPEVEVQETQKMLSLRVESGLAEEFERVARRHERTVSQEIRWLMRERVSGEQPEQHEAAAA